MNTTKEEITLSTYAGVGNRNTIFSASVADYVLAQYGPLVAKEVLLALIKRIEAEWWERHGAEVLDSLAPGVITAAIRTKLEAAIVKKVMA